MGEFIIEERIGEGGMGVVYRAVHALIGKQAAIKVMRMELVSPQQVQRLLVEARAVNAIRHQGIIDIFGYGTLTDERPYVIMELLRGRPLSDLVHAQARMDVENAVWVMDQMLAALSAAHEAGVVHRDLKPANVFVVESSGISTTIKLVDFGIAKLLEACEIPLTSEGSILGTPEYMAPEQIRGGAVGPATDLYAAGVMLFQMLTGVRPFQGNAVQVMYAHTNHAPAVPSSLIPGLPPELDALVLHLLAKEPSARPASADEVREQLKRIPLQGALQAPSLPNRDASLEASSGADTITAAVQQGRKASRGSRRHAAWVGGALMLLGLGAAVLWPGRETPPAVVATPTLASTAVRVEPPASVEEVTPPPATQPIAAPSLVAAMDAGAPETPPTVEVTPPVVERKAVGEPLPPHDAPPSPKPAPTKKAAKKARTQAPKQKSTARPGTTKEDLAAQHRLTPRINGLFQTLKERSKGKKPPRELEDELVEALKSANKAPTEQQCADIEWQLDKWEKRLNQQFPSP